MVVQHLSMSTSESLNFVDSDPSINPSAPSFSPSDASDSTASSDASHSLMQEVQRRVHALVSLTRWRFPRRGVCSTPHTPLCCGVPCKRIGAERGNGRPGVRHPGRRRRLRATRPRCDPLEFLRSLGAVGLSPIGEKSLRLTSLLAAVGGRDPRRLPTTSSSSSSHPAVGCLGSPCPPPF